MTPTVELSPTPPSDPLRPEPTEVLDLWGWRLRPLALDAMPLFRHYFDQIQVPLSDYSFANSVVWQSHQRFLYAVIGDCLCMFKLRDGVLSMDLSPLGPSDAAIEAADECIALMERFNQRPAGWEIRCAHEGFIEAQEKSLRLAPPRRPRTVVNCPPDYIYDTVELVELRGGDFKSKRNDINQLLRAHSDVELAPLRPEHLPDIVGLCEQWLRQRQTGVDGTLESLALEESHAIIAAVTHMNALGLTGLRLLVDGRLEAFILGERLLPTVGHVLFEKSNRGLRGTAQLIFREYCRTLADCAVTNCGDALGCESLARAKQSYRPLHLGRKFSICSLRC